MVLYAHVHMSMSVYQVPGYDCPLSKSRAQVPRSFPIRKPNCLYLPLLRAFPLRKDIHPWTFLLFTFVLVFYSLHLFFSFPYLFYFVQPLSFVPEIDQATEVYVKDAAKN